MNLGNALRALGRNDEAIHAYQRAVHLAPESAEARFNLALQRLTGGDVDVARDELGEVIRLQPGLVEAHLVLADILERQGKLDEAEASFIRALELDPNHSGARLNYGTFCDRLGRPYEASRLLEQAKALDPGIKGVESPILFGLNFRTDVTADEIAQVHRRIGAEIQQASGPAFQTWSNVPDPERRLRLAYVSGDFHHHPVSLFLRPVLEHHDPIQLEVVCYSNRDDDNDVAAVLRRACSLWRNVSPLDHEAFARVIRDDRIDILADLSGHSADNRLRMWWVHVNDANGRQ